AQPERRSRAELLSVPPAGALRASVGSRERGPGREVCIRQAGALATLTAGRSHPAARLPAQDPGLYVHARPLGPPRARTAPPDARGKAPPAQFPERASTSSETVGASAGGSCRGRRARSAIWRCCSREG